MDGDFLSLSGLEKSRQRKCHVVHSIPSKKMTITIKSKFVVATRGDKKKKTNKKLAPKKQTTTTKRKVKRKARTERSFENVATWTPWPDI